jgi:hypothetical protein
MFCAGAAFGQITVGDDDPEAIEPPENLPYMMDRRGAA